MGTSNSVDASIDHVVTIGLSPFLGRAQFKREGRIFARASHDLFHVVGVQGSLRNEGDAGRFTVNLAVASPEIGRRWRHPKVIKSPADDACWLVSIRLGTLLDPPSDLWWDLDSDTDLAEIAAEVAELVEEDALSFLDAAAFRTSRDLLDRLEGRTPLPIREADREEIHALLLHQCGRGGEAIALLHKLAKRGRAKPWLADYTLRMEKLARQLEEDCSPTITGRGPMVSR